MTRNTKNNALLTHIKNFFTRNIAIKIVSVVFATLLWGYVLTDQKPVRIKTIQNVSTSFDGEAELLAQGLCIRGNRSDILRDVTVNVRAQINNYAYLNNRTINATVSLRNISEARTYELPVAATVSSGLGVVQTVTPSTVTVEIDNLRKKTVPVATLFVGELPEGYWADMDAISATAKIDIEGAVTDIKRISRAECTIDLTDRTSTIYSTFDVVFYDSDGNVVSPDIIVGTLPSSTVRLPIYPMRYVPIDVMGSLVGVDNLAANHELVSAVATPATVRIVGSQFALDATNSVSLAPIAVNGFNTTTTVESEIIVPDGVRLLDTDPVSVLIEVREGMLEKTFEQIPIEVRGQQDDSYVVSVMPDKADVTISGRISVASLVSRGDISLYVDVTDLGIGLYTLEPELFVRDEESTVELATDVSVGTVQVLIKEKKP